jgi:hypothetical protein
MHEDREASKALAATAKRYDARFCVRTPEGTADLNWKGEWQKKGKR